MIPIPFVDDLAKSYFQRRLVGKLAAANGLYLDSASTKMLADDPGQGCLWGCIISLTLGLVKWLFRKVFFFLEWKRTIDLVSRSYHHAYLLDFVFSSGWCAPQGPRTPAEIRGAVDDVRGAAPIKPVEEAVKLSFSKSKSLLKSAAGLMQRSVKRIAGRPSPEQIEQAIEQVEEQEEKEVSGLAANLQTAIGTIPDEHFKRLRESLAVRLGFPPNNEDNQRRWLST